MKVSQLLQKKETLENTGKAGTIEYINCLANIIYFNFKETKPDFNNIKIYFVLGLERIYGPINFEISDKIDEALGLMCEGNYKGFCLLSAIIASLEKCKEDKS